MRNNEDKLVELESHAYAVDLCFASSLKCIVLYIVLAG